MSKLIDKLNEVSQIAPRSIGFRAARTVSLKSKILLIASLAPTDADSLVDFTAGADAGLLHVSKFGSEVKILQMMCQASPDIPWGAWLKNASLKQIKQVARTGCDFIVFPAANTPLTTVENEKCGRILVVEPSLREGLLRVVNELPVNAVLITNDPEGGYSLTWHNLMLFQHFANLLTKPLLVPVPSNVTGSELKTLWKAGVDGVIVEVGRGQPTERFKELRQLIDKLTFPLPRRPRKKEALLPHMAADTDTLPEEDEE